MSKRFTRRQFIKSSIAGSLAFSTRSPLSFASSNPPNILVVMVDEMRLPYGPSGWIPTAMQQQWLPNMHGLWSKSACFQNHFTGAVACSPARASLLTGLYAQQHNLLSTIVDSGSPSLQTAFPTWGSALQKMNYDTFWYGKFHLTQPNLVPLSSYGFQGTIVDDPDGEPGQGYRRDPGTAALFQEWLSGRVSSSSKKPFCTTVSFVNPHDICWFYRLSDCIAAEAGPFPDFGPGFLDSSYFQNMQRNGIPVPGYPCPNFENPLATSTPKPSLQKFFATQVMPAFGAGISWDPSTLGQPTSTACAASPQTVQAFGEWYKLLQLYFYLHNMVDQQIGAVLNALWNSPYADNTIVIFTADHGEYGGAHGLHTKGGAAYEEAIKIPLSVYDPTGLYVSSPSEPRVGLTSSVDIMPLLMTLAGQGSSLWKLAYPYLAGRYPLSSMLLNPSTAGRDHVLFSTDECFSGGGSTPFHVLTLRTNQAKLSTYSNWTGQTAKINPEGQELELYDYTSSEGTAEISNVASSSDLTSQYLAALLGTGGNGGLVATEMQGALPSSLVPAQQTALQQYYQYIQTIQNGG